MDDFIDHFDNLQLVAIGDPEFFVGEKENALQMIKGNIYEGVPIMPYPNFRPNWPDIGIFAAALLNLKRFIEQFYNASEHGILNVGSYYTFYIHVRNSYRAEVARINADQTLTQEQRLILIYCLLPGYNLPDYTPEYNPDKARGEKTFSKMLLNLAVMQSKCRYEHIEGFNRAFVLQHYP